MDKKGGGIKSRLTFILLSFAIAISGWIIPEIPIYAASVTVTASGGYLYIPTAVGCPKVYNIWTAYGSYSQDYETVYYGFPVFCPEGSSPSYSSKTPVKTGLKAIYWKEDWTPDDCDSDGTYSMGSWYFGVTGNPEIVGSNIRFRLTCSYETGWYNGSTYWTKSAPSGSWTYSDDSWYNGSSLYYIANGSHSFASNTAATCTAAATQKCSKCGAIQSVGNALGHNWGNWITTLEATPYAAGSKKHICSRNSSHVETVTIPQKHFQIYSSGSRINKIYLGNTLIMNSSAGTNTLVK